LASSTLEEATKITAKDLNASSLRPVEKKEKQQST